MHATQTTMRDMLIRNERGLDRAPAHASHSMWAAEATRSCFRHRLASVLRSFARGRAEIMKPKLRVRVGRNYAVKFNILHGQRNAHFISGPTNPLERISSRLDCISIVEPGYDLVHTFNEIPILTSCPFLVTFEDYAPRLPDDRPIPPLSSYLRKKLIGKQCVGLVAISSYAMRQMKAQHQHCKQDLAALVEKTEIVYPALNIRRSGPKRLSPPLMLLFVGFDYFRKGGPAVVRAHNLLKKAGIDVQTSIVSSLAWSPDDYVGPPDPISVNACLKELNSEGIRYHRSLPNDEVGMLMEMSDFLVLPTLHDTFGYVSIEALAAGTPVIASATCAQPEIVEPDRSGFLLAFENDAEIGKWKWLYQQRHSHYVDAYWAAINSLANSIFVQLEAFYEQRACYERLSAGALDQAVKKFSVERARETLESIYNRVLNRE